MDLKTNVMYVAEISANHNGSLKRAHDLIEAAAKASATAVKFQTYTPDTMTLNLPGFEVSSGHKLWGSKSLYSLYSQAMMPWEWHAELFQHAQELNLIPFSTPFDASAVDFLESLDAKMYKIASLESTHMPLVKAVGRTGKPTIISTGATTYNEIAQCVDVFKSTGNEKLTLLLCTSAYPAEPIDANLRRMEKLKKDFGTEVGISDHTLGMGVSIAAIALGATVVEKHITLKRSDGGLDSAFSMEPNEFHELVKEGNAAADSLGYDTWVITESESESRRLRRSLYITENVKEGELITPSNLKALRPGFGCETKYFELLIGKTFRQDFNKGTPMSIDYAN